MQMSRVKRGSVQEIVYEVQGNAQGNKESIYTSRNGVPAQPAVSRLVQFPQSSTKTPSVTFSSVTSGFNRIASPAPINVPQVRVSSPSPPAASIAPVRVQVSPAPMSMTPARIQSPPPMNMTPIRVQSPPPMNMTPVRGQSPPIQMPPAQSMTAITSLRN